MRNPDLSRRREREIGSIKSTDERCKNLLRLLQGENDADKVKRIVVALVDIYCSGMDIEKKRTFYFTLLLRFESKIRNLIIQSHSYTGHETRSPRCFIDFNIDEESPHFMRVAYWRELRTLDDHIAVTFFKEENGESEEEEEKKVVETAKPEAKKSPPKKVKKVQKKVQKAMKRQTSQEVEAAHRRADISASRSNVETRRRLKAQREEENRRAIAERHARAAQAAKIIAEGNDQSGSALMNNIRDAVQSGNVDLIYRRIEDMNMFLMDADSVPHHQRRFLSLMVRKMQIQKELNQFLIDLNRAWSGVQSSASVNIPLGGNGKCELMLEYCNDRFNILLVGDVSEAVRKRWDSLSGE